jgi:hypothetical protein
MKIFVKTVIEQTIVLDVNPSTVIQTIKDMVQEQSIVDCSNQSIYFGGKKLDANKTISDYNIYNNRRDALWFEMRMIK